MSAAGPNPGDDRNFVPPGFQVPAALTAGALRLEPLGPQQPNGDSTVTGAPAGPAARR